MAAAAATNGTSNGGGAARPRWRCTKCNKSLSSKRSYDEHMNVHNDKRPFACDECKYAAASQMTLRRHKLRNHTPRSQWGYECPHCKEQYMEPASYQQHVSSRHAGFSATFGCTFCPFKTKSSKHFRIHMTKHFHVVARHPTSASSANMVLTSDKGALELRSINVADYLVDDENGRGYSVAGDKEPTPQPIIIHQPSSSIARSSSAFPEYDPDFFKTPLEPKPPVPPPLVPNSRPTTRKHAPSLKSEPLSTRRIPATSTSLQHNGTIGNARVGPARPSDLRTPPPSSVSEEEIFVRVDALEIPDIQSEIVIEEAETRPSKLPPLKADMDDFELD